MHCSGKWCIHLGPSGYSQAELERAVADPGLQLAFKSHGPPVGDTLGCGNADEEAGLVQESVFKGCMKWSYCSPYSQRGKWRRLMRRGVVNRCGERSRDSRP